MFIDPRNLLTATTLQEGQFAFLAKLHMYIIPYIGLS